MFSDERLAGTPEILGESKIIVQTRKCKPDESLENVVAPEPEQQGRNFYAALRERHGRHWENRKPATGGYNCAGLVWASRRTCLFKHQDWRRILNDDDYRKTVEPDVLPGDIAVYVRAADVGKVASPEILHVARVCHLRQHQIAGPVPWVISKWNNQSGEDLHAVRDCAPLCGGEQYELEFWTDRPIPKVDLVLPG